MLKSRYNKFLTILCLAGTLLAGPLAVFAQAPNDQYYPDQWYLEKITAPKAWDTVTGSKDIVVAVIDSGVDIDHPDLQGNIWVNIDEDIGNNIDNDHNGYADDANGYDFVTNTGDPRPKVNGSYNEGGYKHGTFVAGIIAGVGNNTKGIAGVAWKVKIMSLRAMDEEGNGAVENIIRAIDYAIANGAKIINMSFVGRGQSFAGGELEKAVKRAYDAGIVLVAAAGNSTTILELVEEDLNINPAYPVCFQSATGEDWVVGVTAVDKNDKKTSWAYYGSKCIDVAAPGVDIFGLQAYNSSLGFTNYYSGTETTGDTWQGTSFAAPQVTGAVALVLTMNPNLKPVQVIDLLKKNGDNINAYNSLFYAGEIGTRLNLSKLIAATAQLPGSQTGAAQNAKVFAVAPMSGFKPVVNLYDENLKLTKSFLAYDAKFTGGVKVALGDVNGDKKLELVTIPSTSGGAHVKVFDLQGVLLSQFSAYDNLNTGYNLAVGDINTDGKDEIIVAPAKNYKPLVRVFTMYGDAKGEWLAYEESFKGGVSVTSGDVDHDGFKELVTGRGKGGAPEVKIFSYKGKLESTFMADASTVTNGLVLSIGDYDGEGHDDLLIALGAGAKAQVKAFSSKGAVLGSMKPFGGTYTGGFRFAGGNWQGDKKTEIFASAAGQTYQVYIYDTKSSVLKNINTIDGYKGELNLSVK